MPVSSDRGRDTAGGNYLANHPVPPLHYPDVQTPSQPSVGAASDVRTAVSTTPSSSSRGAGTNIVKQAQDVKGQQKEGGNLANRPVPPLHYPDVQTPSQPSVGAASDVRTAVSTTPSSSSRGAGTNIVKQAQDVKGQQKAGGNLANRPVPPLHYPDVQTPSQPSVGAASDVRTAVSTTPSSSSRGSSPVKLPIQSPERSTTFSSSAGSAISSSVVDRKRSIGSL
uniref:Uncharacterized protein n=1 Tax=Ananas comosus var. bracteatus TaxID=296719 RepID=A0A6V7PVL1_ANACO|nr:unnamed protein product [Ananas comosus var. bracteatus]